MTQSPYFTLITGASTGIGKALAFECASRGHHLALVSLPNEGLADTATEIHNQFGVEVRYLETDLARQEAAQEVYDWTESRGMIINVLVNNAGIGMIGAFDTHRAQMYQTMTLLNTLTPMLLCYFYLPRMKTLDQAWILNIGSVASMVPVPYKTIYTSTKAYLYYLSRSLQQELKGSSVSVTVILPNGVPTSPSTIDQLKTSGLIGRLATVTAEEVAKISMDKLYRKKKYFVPGFLNRIGLFVLARVLPTRWSMIILARQFGSKDPSSNFRTAPKEVERIT